MKDNLDEMFASDLSKLAMPSELAMNAAKVKNAQTDKPGAEKPDLYAKGKGKGKDGKPAKDEENDERKSKGPNKGEKKDPNAEDKQQGAKSKDDMDKKAADSDERAYTATRYYKKRFLRPGMKEVRRTLAIRGKVPGGALVPGEKTVTKKASIDEEFDADMRQIVGAETAEDSPNFDRPDVKIAGQTTDAIDDHFIGWMEEKADEDVVKEASVKEAGRRDVMKELLGTGNTAKAREVLAKKLKGAAAKGAAGGALVAAPVAAGVAYHAGKKKSREKKAELEQTKEAGVDENPENLDLLARLRRSAEQKAGLGLLSGTGDV
jgi:hypothetical protein